MDTANILLVIANFLLVAATIGLLIATAVYAKATKLMDKIMNRQAEITKLQTYLNAQYAMIIGPNNEIKNLIHKVSKPYLDRFEENSEEILKTIFEYDTKS
jgi:hypothetical protein